MTKYTNPQLKEICQQQGIHNDYNFANGAVYISRTSQELGRVTRFASWNVVKRGEKLSNEWGNTDTKQFYIWNISERETRLIEAKAFALKRFGISEWVRGPFGAYYDKKFVEKRLAEIIEKYESESHKESVK